MTYQEALVPLVESAYDDLFKNADKLGDKLDYKASETTRTPLEQVVECATSPGFMAGTIRDRKLPDMSGEMPSFDHLKTVADCRAHFDSVKEPMYEAIRAFPDEFLLETIETPWGTFLWRDFLAYAYWNPMYHVGQLAYIQMIHGDAEMV